LTPESLGLPANPEEPGPAVTYHGTPPAPPAQPTTLADVLAPAPNSGFYNHQECPPGRRGCVLSRTVTDDRVTTQLRCPQGASYQGRALVLRRLEIKDLVIEAVDMDVNHEPDAPLTRGQVRAPLERMENQLRACFHASKTNAQLSMHVVVIPHGGFYVLEVTGKKPARVETAEAADCVIETIRGLGYFASAPTTTRARWRFEYTVLDPAAYVKPLDCSFVPAQP
jgi:hypothetical protein